MVGLISSGMKLICARVLGFVLEFWDFASNLRMSSMEEGA